MAIAGVNNYTTYANYDTDILQNKKNTNNKQAAGRTYGDVRGYRTYLTGKYSCLTNSDYSVSINSSLLEKAVRDEKTSKWLEYNLSLIPKVMDNIRSKVAARGSRILSCSITMDGYDSMTTILVTKYGDDSETAREKSEEKIKKIKEEKETEEKEAEERRLEELTVGYDIDLIDKVLDIHAFDQKI